MKEFDKDKELKKLNIKQNSNTYIKRLSISLSFLILLFIVIMLTFAKFETQSPEYTLLNGIIKHGDNADLTVVALVDGQSSSFPKNHYEYTLNSVECTDPDGDVNVTYDEDTWYITNLEIKDTTKCYFNFTRNTSWDFDYVDRIQEISLPYAGTYKIQLWGAQGGTYNANMYGGYGAYTEGLIELPINQKLYIVVGSQPPNTNANYQGGYNGGGTCSSSKDQDGRTGGGATDIRLVGGTWSDVESLNSRIMVAGAGGGAAGGNNYSTYHATGGAAGGITGYVTNNYTSTSFSYSGTGGSQIAGGYYKKSSSNSTAKGKFGKGGGAADNEGSGGGAGYYGGGGSASAGAGGGGSSYISGHTGCVAISEGSTAEPRAVKTTGCTTGTTDNSCSIHYSNLVFTNTKMIDGEGYSWTNDVGDQEQMPTPDGELYDLGTGHVGNGHARITYISQD